jgi:glycosyltransferase involved in cell wall biosynthesis
MIWLASFPRSGNTFFRNVLHEVYGIKSSTFHRDPARDPDRNFANRAVVKTHELPIHLPDELRELPAVYLVRDGRDALNSIAHHRRDIVVPGSDWYNNLLEAALAHQEGFFGGWSENVRQWTARAAVVIRFEDLIADPIREVEKLRAIIELPEPDREKLPTFKDLKFGRPAYGGGRGDKFSAERVAKHFRAGKVGGWKNELPEEMQWLLNLVHGPTLARFGYPDVIDATTLPHRQVLIEASKLYGQDNDGVKRYLAGLIEGLSVLLPFLPNYDISLYDRGGIQPIKAQARLPLTEFKNLTEKEVILADRRTMGYEKYLLLLKNTVREVLPKSLYGQMAAYYLRGPFRPVLDRVKRGARRVKAATEGDVNKEKLRTADLVHLPLPQHFDAAEQTDAPLLVTVHDLTHHITPEFHDQLNIGLAEDGMRELLRRSAYFLNVSQATQADLARVYELPEDASFLVYEAADTHVFRRKKKQDGNANWPAAYLPTDTPYLLCLSTIEPRKNLRNTLLAFLALKEQHPELEATLVVAGKRGWKTREIFAGLDLERPDLLFTGFVKDLDLPALYAHATALCYASHYEGFGLPLLEAMACGTPVIYGNNSSQPEVAAAGGIPVDADDVPAITAAMYTMLTDQEQRDALSAAAWSQAHKFSWVKTALQTLAVYEEIISRQ